MHTMARHDKGWEVGYFEPHADIDGQLFHTWVRLAIYLEARNAAAMVNYLNGGETPLLNLTEKLGA